MDYIYYHRRKDLNTYPLVTIDTFREPVIILELPCILELSLILLVTITYFYTTLLVTIVWILYCYFILFTRNR